MNITLTPEQITIINQRQAAVTAHRTEVSHAEDKLNLFVVGIVSASGFSGKFTYRFDGKQLIAEAPPEVVETIEE